MSVESRLIIDEDNKNSLITYHRRDVNFSTAIQCTSSIVINLPQLQSELVEQHQHEKETLNELNQRLNLFLNRIQTLQIQNSKYLSAITDIRKQFSGINNNDIQLDDQYLTINSNLSVISTEKIDYEGDYELFQLQIDIYRQLIDLQQKSKNQRIQILEEELKQTEVILLELRTHHDQLQGQVINLHAENENLLEQYLSLTYQWSNTKKQKQKSNLNVKILKNSTGFYKNLRTYLVQDFKFLLIQSDNLAEFWKLELDKVIQKIRHDFEIFYSTLNDQMQFDYQIKTEELETNIKQFLHNQQIEDEQYFIYQQQLQSEYEKEQKNLSEQRQYFIQLENLYSQLENEHRSIQQQHEEQYAGQLNDLQNVQDSLMILADDVDDIRRSKGNLELEIIVYRQLLELSGIELPPTIVSRTQVIGTGSMRKIAIKKQKKGPIGIKECAPNGTYISLMNYATNKDIDMSRWLLIRHIDSVTNLRYTIPDGIRLGQGKELRIYAKVNGGISNEPTPFEKLIANNLVSWGEGSSIETHLFNPNGDKEASYLQSIAF